MTLYAKTRYLTAYTPHRKKKENINTNTQRHKTPNPHLALYPPFRISETVPRLRITLRLGSAQRHLGADKVFYGQLRTTFASDGARVADARDADGREDFDKGDVGGCQGQVGGLHCVEVVVQRKARGKRGLRGKNRDVSGKYIYMWS